MKLYIEYKKNKKDEETQILVIPEMERNEYIENSYVQTFKTLRRDLLGVTYYKGLFKKYVEISPISIREPYRIPNVVCFKELPE